MKKHEISKNVVAVVILGIIVVILGGIWALIQNFGRVEKGPKTAKVFQNGKELYAISLEEVRKPYEIEIKGEQGERNIIWVEKGKISMKEASCPDQICVQAGAITNIGVPIICLPNHLVIRIEKDSGSNVDMTAY